MTSSCACLRLSANDGATIKVREGFVVPWPTSWWWPLFHSLSYLCGWTCNWPRNEDYSIYSCCCTALWLFFFYAGTCFLDCLIHHVKDLYIILISYTFPLAVLIYYNIYILRYMYIWRIVKCCTCYSLADYPHLFSPIFILFLCRNENDFRADCLLFFLSVYYKRMIKSLSLILYIYLLKWWRNCWDDIDFSSTLIFIRFNIKEGRKSYYYYTIMWVYIIYL